MRCKYIDYFVRGSVFLLRDGGYYMIHRVYDRGHTAAGLVHTAEYTQYTVYASQQRIHTQRVLLYERVKRGKCNYTNKKAYHI